MICVIPCGMKKEPAARAAAELYCGSYFRACRDYALSILPADNVVILSAKHGFVPLSRLVEPYDVRFNRTGQIETDVLRAQAQDMGYDREIGLVLGGKDYVRRTDGLFRRRYVLTHLMRTDKPAGIGVQIGWLTSHKGTWPPELTSLAQAYTSR